jgi:3-hydroxyisobutyrate dehydrogenase-like beta-hydroxyacid dehydrogenase
MATDHPMQLGMVGLGRMGANLVSRLVRDGHTCVVYDVNEAASPDSSATRRRRVVARGPRVKARRTARGVAHAARRDHHDTLNELTQYL